MQSARPPTPPTAAGGSNLSAVGGEPWDQYVAKTLRTLQRLYHQYVKPLEAVYKYDLFKPSWYEESLINAKPFITLFGPWSAGKSTLINHLLQSNHLWTGPQPTTAQFTVVMHGDEPAPVAGRVLAASKDLPFRGLVEFGDSFLECFQGHQVSHELLKSVVLVDTPGVLESSKEIHQRKYDYIRVCRWFTERSDLVLVLFDPTKMDAGVELRMLFKHAFRGNEGKVRIVLNKADSVETQELMRVYGALYWNLSNMVNTTEPPRVYVGSFWDQPYREGTFHELFSEEKADLIHEIAETIPLQALDKKVTSLLRRAKEVYIHALLMGVMRESLPMLFGKEKAKRKALEDLPVTYERVGQRFKMNYKDFPPVEDYRNFLSKFDLEDFPKLERVEKDGLLARINELCDTILPRLLRPIKSASADPRDRNRARDLQQLYQRTIAGQMMGREGTQGGELLPPAYRASPLDLKKQMEEQQAAQAAATTPQPSIASPAHVVSGVPLDPNALAMHHMLAMQQAAFAMQGGTPMMPMMMPGYYPSMVPPATATPPPPISMPPNAQLPPAVQLHMLQQQQMMMAQQQQLAQQQQKQAQVAATMAPPSPPPPPQAPPPPQQQQQQQQQQQNETSTARPRDVNNNDDNEGTTAPGGAEMSQCASAIPAAGTNGSVGAPLPQPTPSPPPPQAPPSAPPNDTATTPATTTGSDQMQAMMQAMMSNPQMMAQMMQMMQQQQQQQQQQ